MDELNEACQRFQQQLDQQRQHVQDAFDNIREQQRRTAEQEQRTREQHEQTAAARDKAAQARERGLDRLQRDLAKQQAHQQAQALELQQRTLGIEAREQAVAAQEQALLTMQERARSHLRLMLEVNTLVLNRLQAPAEIGALEAQHPVPDLTTSDASLPVSAPERSMLSDQQWRWLWHQQSSIAQGVGGPPSLAAAAAATAGHNTASGRPDKARGFEPRSMPGNVAGTAASAAPCLQGDALRRPRPAGPQGGADVPDELPTGGRGTAGSPHRQGQSDLHQYHAGQTNRSPHRLGQGGVGNPVRARGSQVLGEHSWADHHQRLQSSRPPETKQPGTKARAGDQGQHSSDQAVIQGPEGRPGPKGGKKRAASRDARPDPSTVQPHPPLPQLNSLQRDSLSQPNSLRHDSLPSSSSMGLTKQQVKERHMSADRDDSGLVLNAMQPAEQGSQPASQTMQSQGDDAHHQPADMSDPANLPLGNGNSQQYGDNQPPMLGGGHVFHKRIKLEDAGLSQPTGHDRLQLAEEGLVPLADAGTAEGLPREDKAAVLPHLRRPSPPGFPMYIRTPVGCILDPQVPTQGPVLEPAFDRSLGLAGDGDGTQAPLRHQAHSSQPVDIGNGSLPGSHQPYTPTDGHTIANGQEAPTGSSSQRDDPPAEAVAADAATGGYGRHTDQQDIPGRNGPWQQQQPPCKGQQKQKQNPQAQGHQQQWDGHRQKQQPKERHRHNEYNQDEAQGQFQSHGNDRRYGYDRGRYPDSDHQQPYQDRQRWQQPRHQQQQQQQPPRQDRKQQQPGYQDRQPQQQPKFRQPLQPHPSQQRQQLQPEFSERHQQQPQQQQQQPEQQQKQPEQHHPPLRQQQQPRTSSIEGRTNSVDSNSSQPHHQRRFAPAVPHAGMNGKHTAAAATSAATATGAAAAAGSASAADASASLDPASARPLVAGRRLLARANRSTVPGPRDGQDQAQLQQMLLQFRREEEQAVGGQ